MAIRKVLVAGASGLVGHAAVRHFASLADCEVVAVSRRIPAPVGGAKFLSVDLLDQRRCREVFGQMSDVTHVVYAAVNEKPGLMEGWRDREQMQTNLAMLQNLFGSTQLLQSGDKVVVDEAYVRESILRPAAKITSGFNPTSSTAKTCRRSTFPPNRR